MAGAGWVQGRAVAAAPCAPLLCASPHAQRKPQPLSAPGHASERKRTQGLLPEQQGDTGTPLLLPTTPSCMDSPLEMGAQGADGMRVKERCHIQALLLSVSKELRANRQEKS